MINDGNSTIRIVQCLRKSRSIRNLIERLFGTDSKGNNKLLPYAPSARYDYQLANHIDNFKALGSHLVEFQGLGTDSYGQDLLGHIVAMLGRSLKIIIPALILSFLFGIALK